MLCKYDIFVILLMQGVGGGGDDGQWLGQVLVTTGPNV